MEFFPTRSADVVIWIFDGLVTFFAGTGLSSGLHHLDVAGYFGDYW